MDAHILRKLVLITPLSLILAIQFFRVGIVIINRKGYALRGIDEEILGFATAALILFNVSLSEPFNLLHIILIIVFSIVFITLLSTDWSKNYHLKIYNISSENLTPILESVLSEKGIDYQFGTDRHLLDKFKYEIIISNWRNIDQFAMVINFLKENLSYVTYSKVRVSGIINILVGVAFIVSGIIPWVF